MSVTSGFFNSLNGDRKYNAEQMSSLFNGIINDGVFQNIGTAFAVTVNSGNTINVDTGRAWFNGTWINNDAILPLTFEESEVLVDRIDAIVFDIDHTDSVRAGSIMIVKGTGDETPKNPTLISEDLHHQYPIAYVYRKANSTEILQENITVKVGTSDCPYITGILKTASIDNLLAQWQDNYMSWYKNLQHLLAQWQDNYMSWYKNLQYVLDGNVAGHLQNEIDELKDNVYCDYWALLVDENGNAIVDENSNTIYGVTKKVPYNDLVERDRRLIASSEMPNLKKAIASGVPEAYNFREGDHFVGPKSAYDYILSSYDHHYGGYNDGSVVNIREWTVAVNTNSSHVWNASGNTNGGYATCDLQKYLEGDVLTNVKADMTALGLNLLSRETLLSNATSNGQASSWTWYKKEIVAPTLIELTGDSANIGNFYDIGEANRPLKAFLKYRFNELLPGIWFWARQIASATSAADAYYAGGVAGGDSVTLANNVVGLIDIY